MPENLMELLMREQRKDDIGNLIACNERTLKYGLALTEEEAGKLVADKRDSLKKNRRVEFGESVLPLMIDAFCDSAYINRDEYTKVLSKLQDIFFLYKNEAMDELTDEELIHFMREQFDGICCGSLEYLGETCLERFARAVRAGYGGYRETGGRGEYGRLSEEQGWDWELYMTALADRND